MNIDKQLKKAFKNNSTNFSSKPPKSLSSKGFNTPSMKAFSFPKMNFSKPNNMFNNIGIKKPLSKSKDWDGDGVPNWKDCQPKNVMRQDWIIKKKDNIKFMKPKEFLNMAAQQEEIVDSSSPGSYTSKQLRNDMEDEGYYNFEERKFKPISHLSNMITSKDKIVSVPYMEDKAFKHEEEVEPYIHFDGAHRAYAAEQAGQKTIPVNVKKTQYKTFGGPNDLDGDGVSNYKDCQPKNVMRQHLLKKVSITKQRRGEEIHKYQTPEGIGVTFQTNSRVPLSKHPSLDDVGYILDNLPKGTIPKETEIVFSPRTFRLTNIKTMTTGKTTIPRETAGVHYSDTERNKDLGIANQIRIFPQDKPEEDYKQAYISSYGKYLGKDLFKRDLEKGELKDQIEEDNQPRYVQQLKGTTVHEIGHAVSKKRELEDKWNKAGLSPLTSPTRYGTTNTKEDIAESFVLWSNIPHERTRNKRQTREAQTENINLRKQFFKEHASDIDVKTTPSIREEFESKIASINLTEDEYQTQAFDLIAEQKKKKDYEIEKETLEIEQRKFAKEELERKQKKDYDEKQAKYNSGASLAKQQEWKEKPETVRYVDRTTKPDFDYDGTPDEYDCQPENPDKQDFSEDSTGVPMYTYPRSYGKRRRKVMMSPDRFLQLAKKSYRGGYEFISDKENEDRLSQTNVDRLKPVIESPYGRMTIPILETKRGAIDAHEGRHRALAAKQLGMKQMPVFMVETNERFIKHRENRKPTKAIKWEKKDPRLKKLEDESDTSHKAFPSTQAVSISEIKEDFQEFPEGQAAEETVAGMKEHLSKDKTLPPILISNDGYLQDGRHRLETYKRLGYKNVRVIKGENPYVSEISDSKTGEVFTLGRGNVDGQPYAYVVDDKKTAEKTKDNLVGDNDGDGVINVMDCKPNDKRFHGGELFWKELKRKNIYGIGGTPKERKQVRKVFEKNPELLKPSEGVTIGIVPKEFEKRDSNSGVYNIPDKQNIKTFKDTFTNFKGTGDIIHLKRKFISTKKGKIQSVENIMRHELQHRKEYLENPKQYVKDFKADEKRYKELDKLNKDLKQQTLDFVKARGYDIEEVRKQKEKPKELLEYAERVGKEHEQKFLEIPSEKRAREAEEVPRERDIIVPQEEIDRSYQGFVKRTETEEDKEIVEEEPDDDIEEEK